jgi:hypothetical protein
MRACTFAILAGLAVFSTAPPAHASEKFYVYLVSFSKTQPSAEGIKSGAIGNVLLGINTLWNCPFKAFTGEEWKNPADPNARTIRIGLFASGQARPRGDGTYLLDIEVGEKKLGLDGKQQERKHRLRATVRNQELLIFRWDRPGWRKPIWISIRCNDNSLVRN